MVEEFKMNGCVVERPMAQWVGGWFPVSRFCKSVRRMRLALVLWLGLVSILSVAGGDRPPNILIITADNLGYGDLKSYNPNSEIITPHLDRLAETGARLTSFYTVSPTCTVSRASLLTGRIPQRHGLINQLSGVEGNYGVGLSPTEILIPQLLRQAPVPYATGCFGKWNIGFAEGSRPTERGFDDFLGHASGNMDYYHHNYRERHDLFRGTQPLYRSGEYASDIFAQAAVDFIQTRSEARQPWFCYLPFNAPHFPSPGNKIRGEPNVWQAPDWAFHEYGWSPEEADPRRRYAAVVTALDKSIGDVLAALQQAGVADNTFIFLMSDNGAFRLNRKGLDVGINDPLRSGGVTCWEGGIRVPALASWPDKIPAGSVVDEPLWSADLMNLSVALAGAELPTDRVFDGRNPLAVLVEQANSPHQSLYFEFRKHAALRMGNWKIAREDPADPWQLFDLASDLSESNDLAATHGEQLRRLISEFDRWQQDLARR